MKRLFLILLIICSMAVFSIIAVAEDTTQDIPYLDESGIRDAAALLDTQTKEYRIG